MYAYDVEEYIKEFGLYFDYNGFVAFPIAKNTSELIATIKDIANYNLQYGKQYSDFIDKFCTFEKGNATKQIVDYIIGKM